MRLLQEVHAQARLGSGARPDGDNDCGRTMRVLQIWPEASLYSAAVVETRFFAESVYQVSKKWSIVVARENEKKSSFDSPAIRTMPSV